MTEQELVALQVASSHHRKLLSTSTICGCFNCLSVFGPKEIRKWTQRNSTALCPRCETDTVIGDSSCPGLTRRSLEEMHKRWFEKRSR